MPKLKGTNSGAFKSNGTWTAQRRLTITMHKPISFAKGLDEETKFSFLNLAITKAIGKIPPVAKSRIYRNICAKLCT